MFKEKPILFNAAMVRAILDGRKTQTRRAISHKLMQNADTDQKDSGYVYVEDKYGDWHHVTEFCPYGKVGDRLWVRETFAEKMCSTYGSPDHVFYRADMPDVKKPNGLKWKPSIFMPKKHCRIFLEIVDVRIERLQNIEEKDAMAEGLKCLTKDGHITHKYGIPDLDGWPGACDIGWEWTNWDVCPVKAFKHLWTKTNGGKSWDDNPWVWVVEFKVVDNA